MLWCAGFNTSREMVWEWAKKISTSIDCPAWKVSDIFSWNNGSHYLTVSKDAPINVCAIGYADLGSGYKFLPSMRKDDLYLLASEYYSGQYAFIINHDNKFIAVNDLYALKPIYYTEHSGSIFVSTDIRALLCLPSKEICPSPEAIAKCLDFRAADDDNELCSATNYDTIYKVPAIHSLHIKGKEATIVPSNYVVPNINYEITLDASVKKIESILCKNTKLIEASGCNAIFDLSGGIDSSTVAAAAIRSGLKEKIISASLIFNEGGYYADDLHLIELFNNKYTLNNLKISCEQVIKDEFNHVPFLGPGNVACYSYLLEVQKLSSLYNVKFHFTGEGADYHFEGCPILFDIFFARRELRMFWNNFTATTIDLSFIKKIRVLLLSVFCTPQYALKMFRKMGKRKTSSLVRTHRLLTEKGIRCLPPLKAPALPNSYFRHRKNFKNIAQTSMWDMLFPRATFTDIFAHMPVDVCIPYLSKDMIDFAFTIPPDIIVDSALVNHLNYYASAKIPLRNSFSDIIPKEISQKKNKTTYNHLAIVLLRNNIDRMAEDFFLDQSPGLIADGYLNAERMKYFLDGFRIISEYESTSLGEDYIYLCQLYDLQNWLIRIKDRNKFLYDSFSSFRMVAA